MAQVTSARAAARQAAAAASDLLRTRTDAVGVLAEAAFEEEQAAAQYETARGQRSAKYQAALDVGWTRDELAALGFEDPDARRSARRRAGGPGAATPVLANGAEHEEAPSGAASDPAPAFGDQHQPEAEPADVGAPLITEPTGY